MEQPIQHTDKELELLMIEKLKNILQQQEAIQIMESQQDLINSAITQQKDLNIISDSVIEDLEKSNKELKANTSTPTIDYKKIEDIVKANTPTAKQTGKEVYEELFIDNNKKDKENDRENARYSRNLKKLKEYAKATAKAKK